MDTVLNKPFDRVDVTAQTARKHPEKLVFMKEIKQLKRNPFVQSTDGFVTR